MRYAIILLLFGLMGVGPGAPGEGIGTSSRDKCDSTFTNPVMEGADPWVVHREGYYYFCRSRAGGIEISRSRKLTEPANWVRVWEQPDTGWNSAHLWAPELHYLDGRWYIYYTAGSSGPPFTTQRSGVLEAATEDPRGAYRDRGKLYTGDHIAERTENTWSIDLTPLPIGGRLYAVWSGWKENRDDDATTQHLYIAEMNSPTEIGSNRIRISSPVEPWERGEEVAFGINEGPQVLRRGDEVFLIYSTRESWLPHYRLGQLRLDGADRDPMDPDSWSKKGPVFEGTDRIHGVGHASSITSPDGTEHWIVYHSKKSTEPGWDRDIRMQSFTWSSDGNPEFGKPVATGIPLEVPSGECKDR